MSTTERNSSISATELHDLLLHTHASGNIIRKRFIDGLRALHDQRLYTQLGFESTVKYAETTFGYKKSKTYDFLRASKALRELPELTEAFEVGELSWSLVAELSSVSEPGTEREWLEFLDEHGAARTHAEIKAARLKGRSKPRDGAFGLPGLPVQLCFELTAEQHAVVRQGLAKIDAEMNDGLDVSGSRDIVTSSPEQILLYLMDRILHTERVDEGRAERRHSPHQVVFHQCDACRRTSVDSADGRVEVAEEALERFVPEATVPPEGRDRPNTPALRRALIERSGGCCENPMCWRRIGEDGHGHHVVARSAGGATELYNEQYLCPRCHSLVHSGNLEVKSDGVGGFSWTTRAADLSRRVREELRSSRALPQLVAVEFSGVPESQLEDVVQGLRRLGYSKKEAERRGAQAAARSCEGASIADLVRLALSGEDGPRKETGIKS